MANKNYQVGLLITGDAKKGVKATQLTRDGLKDLSAQQKKTSKSTKDLSGKTGSMIGKLGKVASVTGLATAALGSMGAVMRTQAITEMKVMADTLNISTQTLSEWSTAGEKFNVGGEKMADIFKDIQDKIGDFAATGGGEAGDIFKKLNLDINEFVGLSADQQLLKIGSALDDVASYSEKIFYMEALANDASRLIPLLENGAIGLKTAQEEARLLGTSISDIDAEMIAVAGREMQRMGDISTGLGNTITAAIAPTLGAINSQVTEVALSFGGWEGVVGGTVNFVVDGLAFIADRFDTLYTVLLTIELGYLKIGKAATSAMAGSANSVAELINIALDPLTDVLSLIASGWAQIAIAVGDFTGDDDIVKMGESLASFSADVKDYSIDAADIVAADNAMSNAIVKVTQDIEASKTAASGYTIKTWYKENTEAAEAQAAATVAAKEAQRELGNEVSKTKGASTSELSEDYEKLIKQVDGFSGAWASAGNVIIDTFGSIGQQMEKMFVSQDKYTEAIKYNREEQNKTGADLKKLKAEEVSLAYASTQSQLNGYASIAGAAGSMFSEKTAAAKTFHAVEQALAVASLAMSAKKMIMGTTETGVHVANETTKQSSNALTAISSAFAAPFPVNFIAGASMIGIMSALLGGSFGSSGSAPDSAELRQSTQGTGTVLGSDDKSASILNSYERIEELELDQYAELREMNTSLHDLNNNITHLAASLVSNFGRFDAESYSGELGSVSTTSKFEELIIGGPVGQIFKSIDPTGIVSKVFSSFSSTKRTLLDSGISIVSQTMGEVIDGGLLQAQQYFDIKTKKKKFWGASSKTSYNTEYEDIDEQIEYEMSLIFRSIGDSALSAASLLGFETVDVVQTTVTSGFEDIDGDGTFSSSINKIMGGFTETITTTTEMSLKDALDSYVIDIENISLKDLSGDEIQAELEAVFSKQSDDIAKLLVPGIREFQQVGEGLYETLIRLAQEQAVFNSVLEITGNTLNSLDADQTIAATQAIIEYAGGIENLQSAAGTFFSEFFSEGEQFAYLQKSLTAQFAALGEPLPETAEGFKDLVKSLDPLNEADQKLYAQLLLLSDQSAEYYDALQDISEAEKERLDAISTLKNEITSFVDDLVNPSVDYQSLITAEETRWQNQQDAATKLYETEMSRYEGAISAEKTLDEYINGLAFSDNSILSEIQKQNLAKSNFDDAVNRAKNGDFSAVSDATSAASQYLDLTKSNISGSSYNEQRVFQDAFVSVNKTLSDLQGFYADFEAPDQQIIAESPELISLREQLAASEAAAQQAENQALADLLTSQLGELSELSGNSIDSLIESFSFDLAQIGEILSVNLTELIDVTKNGGSGEQLGVNNAINTDNVVVFPEVVTPVISVTQPLNNSNVNSNTNIGNYSDVVAELKLLREEVAGFRSDSNDNADIAEAQRDSQTSTLEVQTDEIVRSNLRQVAVS